MVRWNNNHAKIIFCVKIFEKEIDMLKGEYVPSRLYAGVSAYSKYKYGLCLQLPKLSDEDLWLLTNQWLANTPHVKIDHSSLDGTRLWIGPEKINAEVEEQHFQNLMLAITAQGLVIVIAMNPKEAFVLRRQTGGLASTGTPLMLVIQ